MPESKPIAVIACAVLGVDLKRVSNQLGLQVEFNFLEAGLHERPGELKKKLQTAIDTISAEGRVQRIVIGYGVCGRGTIGIQARGIPLVIAKVHDCIAMFLGGSAAYRREFARFPGTYYITAGWLEEKAVPISQRGQQAWYGSRRVVRDDVAQRYGEQAAERTMDFLNSWQKTYQRAAFIDTGARRETRSERYAREMAAAYGWTYEKIAGSPALFEKLLTATRTTQEVLFVKPEHVIAFDAVRESLSARPLWTDNDNSAHRTIVLEEENGSPASGARLGLGIDAGGTYTDAVIYDFADGETRCKGKALTTRWDFTIGIERALSKLDSDLLKRVDIVALSTTLATNAIVEGDGQKVGLLIMPPYGIYDPQDYTYDPKARIRGRLSIGGQETEPVDKAQVKKIVRDMVAKEQVRAFAVSGFAGAINPDHELAVKRIVHEETGLPTTCGHELSAILDFKIRATTAVLNARIVPRLGALITHLERVLRKKGLGAPIVVVKGDGTLIRSEMARTRPVETIFSGPAASVAGARHLTGIENALVVDMGGTTTDTAALKQGKVQVNSSGSTVAGRRTHVRALDIRTAGLGGDSLIVREKEGFRIGPRRVAPIAWLGTIHGGTGAAIDALAFRTHRFQSSARNMQILVATGTTGDLELTQLERRVMELLGQRPHSIDELIRKTDVHIDRHLPLERLEEAFAIQRCGLTPTDLLHLAGEFERWDTAAAGKFFDIVAELDGTDDILLRNRLIESVARSLALEIVKRQLDDEVDPEALHHCPVCRTLLNNLFSGGNGDYRVHFDFKRPVIGIGAPIAFFLPRAAAMINARAILPEHADVANAIGAITSKVVIERQVRIVPAEVSGFFIEGLSGAMRFKDFDKADAFAKNELAGMVRSLAKEAGTSSRTVTIETQDQLPEDAGGHPVFIGRIVRARLCGPPDRVGASKQQEVSDSP